MNIIKCLRISLTYQDKVEEFIISTKNLQLSLSEIVHRSLLQSKGFPIKIFMSEEFSRTLTLETHEEKGIPLIQKDESLIEVQDVEAFRRLLASKIYLLCDGNENILDQLDQAIYNAKDWFKL